MCRRYIEAQRAGWKSDKHAEQWPSTIRLYVNPVFGRKTVDQITVEDVLKVLQPIWTSKPETAPRVRGRIEKILGWAAAMNYRSGENPRHPAYCETGRPYLRRTSGLD